MMGAGMRPPSRMNASELKRDTGMIGASPRRRSSASAGAVPAPVVSLVEAPET